MKNQLSDFTIDRLPKGLQKQFHKLYTKENCSSDYLRINTIYQGNALHLLPKIETNSIAVSVWSPPYFVGKDYEKHLTFESWKNLLSGVIEKHFPILKPGGFLVINIADILCFKDPEMPRIQAEVVHRKRIPLTKEDILKQLEKNPNMNRYELAKFFNCSEQTIDRRLHGNNVRGGKYETQTRVKVVGGLLEEWALKAGFYLYDRRVWVKDAAWENSRWASLSYKAVDEFEYIYVFWKPGITKHDRKRLTKDEWKNWGSRGVWNFPSVRSNGDHEAKFPIELPSRVIRLFSGVNETVLDCFMGSGTTAIAAIQAKRNYVGIELEKKYVKLAVERINKETGAISKPYFNAN